MGNTRAPLLAAAGVVAVTVLLFLLLVVPKIGQVTTAREELAIAQAQQQSLESRKGALEDLKAKAGENRAAIDDVANRIPPTANESGLILLINNAALNAGLDLVTLSPTPPALDQTSGLSVIVMSMTASGTYNEVTQFAYAIETLPRAAQITSVSLSPTDVANTLGQPELTATLQINAYTTDTGEASGTTEAGP